ncbi:GNAT family N-acetyltransferase [Nitrincola sp.]|uniref:GNAT family N-acetyltransferase n=1 Tax=Nitrincola sp. TaxID=1926584 RepID=UPI003A9279FF
MQFRQIQPQEAPALFALIETNRDYLRQWLPWLDEHRSVEDTGRFIRNITQLFEQQQAFHVGLYRDEEIIGMMSIHYLDWRNRKAALGYWIGEAFQGKGRVTESCKTLINFCFNDLNLNRLEMHCAVHNIASRKIPERLGFEFEGVIREVEWLYDHWVDHALYAILRKDLP